MCAVPSLAVVCSSGFSGMLLTYFMNEFEVVPLLLVSLLFVHSPCAVFLI